MLGIFSVISPADQPHFFTMVCEVACKAGMSGVGSEVIANVSHGGR